MKAPALPFLAWDGSLFGLPLRASNRAFGSRALCEHRRPTGCPLSHLFEQPFHSRLDLVQSLAQVGLKHISLGLRHHALGVELILEQHQFSE
jgi:hypothetical protein